MRAYPTTASWTLAGLAGLSLLVGCVGSDEESLTETEQAYALRAEVSGSTDSKKTFVCHIPPGNPANAHTIHVGNPAVDAHLAHGDSLGECHLVLVPDTGTDCQKRRAHIGRKKIQNVVVREDGSWKVTLCHLPPGNPDNGHAITVGPSAVRAHLAHGDVLGACPAGSGEAEAEAKPRCVDTGDTGTGGDTTETGGDTIGTGGDTTGSEGGSTGSDTPVTPPPADNT